MDKAAPSDQAGLWDPRKRGEDPDLDRRIGLRAGLHRSESVEVSLYTLMQVLSVTEFENLSIDSAVFLEADGSASSMCDNRSNSFS